MRIVHLAATNGMAKPGIMKQASLVTIPSLWAGPELNGRLCGSDGRVCEFVRVRCARWREHAGEPECSGVLSAAAQRAEAAAARRSAARQTHIAGVLSVGRCVGARRAGGTVAHASSS